MNTSFHYKSIAYCSILALHLPLISMDYKGKQEKSNKKKNNQTLAITQEQTKETPKELEQSVVVTQVPTTRGFGLLRSAWDYVWPEEENLLDDLKNNTFDGNHRKLNTAIETFVTKQNDRKLTELFEVCQKNYRHVVKIEDTPALMALTFLVKQNKNKQETLKLKLEKADQETIENTNAALATLKTTISEQIIAMNQALAAHNTAQGKEIETECTEISRLKKGLGNIHKLNKTFTPSQSNDAYWSDDKQQVPEDVTDFYHDSHMLEKIIIDKKLNETKQKIESLLAKLTALNDQIQGLQELRY